jgi:hypothetical protein
MLHGAVGLLSLGSRVAIAAKLPADEPASRIEPVHYAFLGVLALALRLEDRLDLETPSTRRDVRSSTGYTVPEGLLR